MAGLELPHAALLPLPLPQHSLPVAATSPESRTAAAAAAAASQTEVMRRMLAAKAAELDSFKLQFNCCGTGVEKVGATFELMTVDWAVFKEYLCAGLWLHCCCCVALLHGIASAPLPGSWL